MPHPSRTVLVPALLAVVLAACGNDPADDGDTGGVDVFSDTSADSGDVADAVDAGADLDASADPDVGPDLADVTPDTPADTDAGGPPESSIFEIRAQDEAATGDSFYSSEETTRYRAADQFGDAAVSSVEVVADQVFAIAADGVHRLDWNRGHFARFDEPALDGATAIAATSEPGGYALVATPTGFATITQGGRVDTVATDSPVTAVAVGSFRRYGVVASELVWFPGVDPVPGAAGVEVSAVSAGEGVVVVGGSDGLWFISEDTQERVLLSELPIDDVALCDDGDVYATSAGALLHSVGQLTATEIVPGRGSLPTDRATSVTCNADWLIVGHEVGASALARGADHIDHYQSGRWLLDDRVLDVGIDGDRRWFATASGITRVDLVPRTMAAKAAVFLDLHERYFWRLDGFSAAWARTPEPWSYDGLTLHDDDNDGQWTEEMIGALAFAYGATGDAAYCAAARPAVRNMLLEVDLPCLSFEAAGLDCGFITRSFVRDDEGAVFTSKASQPNWHLVEYDGHEYYWKDDTSSDEYAGHYFGLPLFYDLCATEQERADIAERVALATDYLVNNDYYLLDLDGEPTEHGDWSRDYVASCVDGFFNCDAPDPADCAAACFGGGFVNATEILGHLLAAWHVTGDQTYYDEYRRLLIDQRYGEVIVYDDRLLTFLNPAVENHVDHELAMLAFHSLIRYEPDPEWRARWQESLLGIYETELDEENPLWAAFVAGLTGEERQRAAVLESLREYPMDLRYWRFDHSHRLDQSIRPERDRFGNSQLDEWPPPYDEQPVRWWDQSPYYVVSEGDGRSMRGPMGYSIAYWAARYYGLLGEPEQRPHPLLDNGFVLIAHRGGGRLAPESTLPAYENAVSVGADVLECDVHATSDGVLVCMHDETVDRTTNGSGAVRDMTFDELRALDAGYNYSSGGGTYPYRGIGVVVPTLTEVLEAFPNVPWALEIKQSDPPIARQVVDTIEDLGRTHDVGLASFIDITIAEVRAANPDMLTALTAGEMVRFVTLDDGSESEYEPPGLLIQAPLGSGGSDVLSADQLERAHRLGMRVHVWTLNDEDEMTDAVMRGADGIFTDDPARLWGVLVGLGIR